MPRPGRPPRRHRLRLPRALALVPFAAAALAGPAAAEVFTYTDLALFRQACDAVLSVTFEGRPTGPTAAFSENRVRFTAPGNDLVVIAPPAAGPLTNPPPASRALATVGPGEITLTFPGGQAHALGFETTTNAFGAPLVRIAGVDGAALADYVLIQGPNTRGFFGFVSTVPVGTVRWIPDRANLEPVALDNVWGELTWSTPAPGGSWGRLKALYREPGARR